MKTYYNRFLLIPCFITLMLSMFLSTVFCYFSEKTGLEGMITTGSVNVIIDNIKVEKDTIITSNSNFEVSNQVESTKGGTLIVNTIVAFKFTVRNIGNSVIRYSLGISITWDEILSEADKFFVYPYDMNDDDIYRDVITGRFEYAIITSDVSDIKEVSTSSGVKLGILETLDSATLNSDHADGSYNDDSYKDYQFKLFFHEDEELAARPELFENQNVELGIIAEADVVSTMSNWKKAEKRFLNFLCKTDLSLPIIEEVAKPKVFFVNQTDNINLADYAIAFDALDGIITDKMTITSSPAFNPKKAGVYKITYNVTNSFGKMATPLEVTIVIWDFTKIESGNYHTLALTSHGKVYSWGYNYYGQLGDGTVNYNSTPKLVEGLNNIIDIAAGYGSSYALDSNGQAYAWGRNDNGRLGDGTITVRYRPVKVSQTDGVKFVQISARFNNAGAVTAEGDVYTWGYAGYGASGNGSTVENRKPTKINLSNIAHLEMGYYNGAAVTKDGKLYTWGDNYNGQLGNGVPMSISTNAPAIVPYFDDQGIKIKSISVGWYHMAAVTEDGELYTWGYGAEGRLGNGLTANKNTPQKVSIDGTVVKAVAAYFHTGVLTSNGQVYFFGQNLYGKHGTGNIVNHLTPVLLGTITNATDIALAYDSSFVLVGSEIVYGMGYGGTGVLGTGNNNSSDIPVKWVFTPPTPY